MKYCLSLEYSITICSYIYNYLFTVIDFRIWELYKTIYLFVVKMIHCYVVITHKIFVNRIKKYNTYSQQVVSKTPCRVIIK